MPSREAKRISWPEGTDALLAGWRRRALFLGIPTPTDAGSLRAALSHATACRCHEHEKAAPLPDAVAPAANPLQWLRLAAGLSQSQAATRLGLSRSHVSNLEQAPRAHARQVARWRSLATTKKGSQT